MKTGIILLYISDFICRLIYWMKQKKIIFGFLISLWLFSWTSATVYTTENTSIWIGYSDTCSSAETNHIIVTPTSIPTVWTGNTIYDFQAGTYNLTAGIILNNTCTALIGNWKVIINGNGETVITLANTFNIIKNITINSAGADGISSISTNSNTISDTIIYSSNRAIYMTTTTNTILQSIGIFWNIIGIYLNNNTNNNILHNIFSFNNSQNGLYINGWSRNTLNNILSFNNALHGIFIQAGTQNILNNFITYNNNSNGLRLIGGNYINNNKTFNNATNNTIVATNTWYGINYSDIALPVWLKLWLSTDPIVTNIWWTNWSVNSSLVVDQSQILNPFDGTNYLIDTSTGTTTWKWTKSFGTTLDITSSLWWSNIPNQTQPVQWDAGWTILVASPLLFASSKKIGQDPSSTSAWWSSSAGGTVVVCGNNITEQWEQCDDGNTWNWDGCTTTCQIEAPGTCGNAILEYMEQCDDGNLYDGDWCSNTCNIESSTEIYDKKYPSTQKEQFSEITSIKTLIDSWKIKVLNGKIIGYSGGNVLSWITPAQIILLGVQQNESLTPSLECQYNDTDYKNIYFIDLTWPYKKDIETLINYCIIQWRWKDTKNITFAPKQSATYAEFIKVLIKTHFLGRQISFQSSSLPIQTIYPLVSNDTWYAPYITKAYIYDLLLPLEIQSNPKLLDPNASISKLDAITLLIHSLKIAGKEPKNIEAITDTFTDATTPLSREEMAALIVKGYWLDYVASQKIWSNNKMLIKLLSQAIQKYNQQEQLIILQRATKAIGKFQEKYLQKYNIFKKELLEDLENILNLYSL